MSKIRFARKKSDCLLRTITITINNTSYKLKRSSSKEISLPVGIYDVVIGLDWTKTHRQIEVTDEEKTFIIKQTMPNEYFLLGFSVIFILTVLTLFDIIPVVVLGAALTIYFIPLMINMFVNKKNYFKIIRV
jgi:hypothetical protein